MAREIQMCDLRGQYGKIKEEVDDAIRGVLESGIFIKGGEVLKFESEMAEWIGARHCISCANGTDALYLSLLALELPSGAGVITPSFTFVASVEAIIRAGLTPVFVDIDEKTFNLSVASVCEAIEKHQNIRAIIAVHLFGQCAEMEELIEVAEKRNIVIIEDACQSVGAGYNFGNGKRGRAGAMTRLGCTSFFPSKNLGCFGDGGAVFTDDDSFAEAVRSFANHGMKQKYQYERIGVNSRLDAVQAAVLRVKLGHLDEYISARQNAAKMYRVAIADLDERGLINLPYNSAKAEHNYNQFTIRVKGGKRDALKEYLAERGVPTMIYYPSPIHSQKAYAESEAVCPVSLRNTEKACKEVLSLPMHTELMKEDIETIAEGIKSFFEQ